MKLTRYLLLLFVMFWFVVTSSTAVFGQSGSAELPSIGTALGSVYISNPTNGRVVFYLESSGTTQTEHFLEAGDAAPFSGAAGDDWFNIQINSDGGQVDYGLDAGSRHYFEWRGNKLDLYKLPPK